MIARPMLCSAVMAGPVEPSGISIACPGKVNLCLAVGAPDGGYHPVASWMVAVSLIDTLELTPTGCQSQWERGAAADAPAPLSVDWGVEADLAWRAHRRLSEHIGRALPVHARLEKRIPPGMGLGGGSSDAAGMLVGLNRLFGLGLASGVLLRLGAELGSDVPFLVHVLATGEPGGVVTGAGEAVERTVVPEPAELVLVLPRLSCDTGAVYAAFDRLNPKAGAVPKFRVRDLGLAGQVGDARVFNDLAGPAETVNPNLAKAREAVAAATGRRAHVTGAGAGLWLPGGADIASQVYRETGFTAVAVQPQRGAAPGNAVWRAGSDASAGPA